MSGCAKFQPSSLSRSALKVCVGGWGGLQSNFHVQPNCSVEVEVVLQYRWGCNKKILGPKTILGTSKKIVFQKHIINLLSFVI